jgi:REP element-mobilizing transposase RayT
MPITYKAFDFADGVRMYRRKLPHWRQDGCAYFVTFRLGDSIPQHLLREWEAVREGWLLHHPQPWTEAVMAEYHETFTAQMEAYLHAGYGACVLRRREAGAVVADSLECLDRVRYHLGEYVVMPNHVHAILLPIDGFELEQLVGACKGYTSQMINKLLRRRGALWADEYCDHIVRHEAEMNRTAAYIRANPTKAGLRADAVCSGGSSENWLCTPPRCSL